MLYYTQLLYTKPGHEEVFHRFEEAVLPLLARHGGKLLYRVRPANDAVLETAAGYPYEIHLIAFPTRQDFDSYRQDPDRLQFTHLRDASVESAMLIEGVTL